MRRSLQICYVLISSCILLVNCRKKEWDKFYDRPESLEPPIYQVLKRKENFSLLLACIDKAGYKDILSNAGYWTLFAPTDDAFSKYFKENSLSGIDAMDSVKAQQIVRYCLVYNSFNTERLDDYQSTAGWVADKAFKRRTAYYDLFDTATVNGQLLHTIASNRNAGYSSADNNNKYIPYFTNPFFTDSKLTATDYNYFYPGTSFTGLNILDARITETNIPAENGNIHVIDKVLSPLENIEKYLASKPEYSLFNSLFQQFMVSYTENAEATKRFQILNNSSDKVYIKFYNAGLAFSLNNENYLKVQDNDGQMNGWTIFAPTNDVLEPYLKNVVLEHYNNDLSNLNKLPIQTLTDFLNAHLWQNPVWPTKFATTSNYLGEEARFSANSDIVDKKILSNGFFYGAKKVQESNLFSTVYARPYLDPDYTLMTRLLNQDLKQTITNPNFKYTILMMSDAKIRALGFDWDAKSSKWVNTIPGVLGAGDPPGTVNRLVNLCVIATPNNELGNLSGQGIISTLSGELIKWNNGQFYAAGNIDSNVNVTVTGSKVMKNGIAYYTNGLLLFSALTPGKRLEALASQPSSPYYQFFQYLKNAKMYTATTGVISGVPTGFFGTFIIPDNNAILAAVNAGLLPGTGTAPNKVPNYTSTAGVDIEQVESFLKFHMLQQTVIADGKIQTCKTNFTNLNDQPGAVSIVSLAGGILTFTDSFGNTATTDPVNSNVLADRIVIHSINTCLKPNK
ncbi:MULTISPECIES: fasciclin domain-containing protein [Niastella]|uniref:Fasciclin domain-containing protein n=1 Tax=Niastella soli TaxID=2821487 RepID=A0ABS3Z280_9BACT|nr:fasciclin domain-containing protein [Niastella soli]MBO9203785.1 fasciclin domain-containing protein [Niastella soli]